MQNFPQVKEIFFDDDTFTDNLPRVEDTRQGAGQAGHPLGRATPRPTCRARSLKKLKDGGLRLLLVGYESGNQQILHNIKKGLRDRRRRAVHQGLPRAGHRDPRHLHPGPAGRDAGDDPGDPANSPSDINPHTIQVSLAAPYPGTFLYKQAKENGWFDAADADLLTDDGTQIAPLNYPHLGHTEIFDSVEDFYKQFYFRPSKIMARSSRKMLT